MIAVAIINGLVALMSLGIALLSWRFWRKPPAESDARRIIRAGQQMDRELERIRLEEPVPFSEKSVEALHSRTAAPWPHKEET